MRRAVARRPERTAAVTLAETGELENREPDTGEPENRRPPDGNTLGDFFMMIVL